MTFSEFALGLYPFISYDEGEAAYFDQIIMSFINEDVIDDCEILNKRKEDTKYRYIKGSRTIQVKDAKYLFEHRDKENFSEWLYNRMNELHTFYGVNKWLEDHNIVAYDPCDACADLLESIMFDYVTSASKTLVAQDLTVDLGLINEIQNKIRSLPRPSNVSVPAITSQNEQVYIEELFMVYGDAEGMDSFSKDDLSAFPNYSDDLDERRIDFYAAETIRRGVLELKGDSLTGQFDVLKDETFNGVKDTLKRSHPNAYECMLAVMEQAVLTPVTNYLLSSSPYWISGKIKKGVCHHLVNDGKLKWIRRLKKK